MSSEQCRTCGEDVRWSAGVSFDEVGYPCSDPWHTEGEQTDDH